MFHFIIKIIISLSELKNMIISNILKASLRKNVTSSLIFSLNFNPNYGTLHKNNNIFNKHSKKNINPSEKISENQIINPLFNNNTN